LGQASGLALAVRPAGLAELQGQGWVLKIVSAERVENIFRHAQIDVTMDVYTEVSDKQTLRALERLGKQLDS
jgi:hypothetical protein